MFYKKRQGGYTTLLVIVFGSLFVFSVAALSGRVLVEQDAERARMYKAQARAIAEAGLEYYKWFLAHNPDDTQHGTGGAGPYNIAYEDPESDVVGTFSLDITGNEQCGAITSIDIDSTGWSADDPTVRATITGRYAQPSVAEYAYIVDDNVWVGSDRQISGRYHANGGIRFDGTSNSEVSSAVGTWTCTSSFGCSPASTTPGVFGDGGDQELWEYPSPQFDFAGIAQDFNALRTLAQSDGIFYSGYGGHTSEGRGYRLVFQNNRTVDVYQVRRSNIYVGAHIDSGVYENDYYVPRRVRYLGNYSIPSDCGLIYIEDRVWVEGTISGKVTLVAADTTYAGYEPKVIIEDDLEYTTTSGADGLTILAEGDIHISPESPEDLDINAILIAQEGYFGRNLYPCFYPNSHQDTLTVRGSIVSNTRVGTKWGYTYWPWCFNQTSGYENRVNSYDRNLATDPPPFTPVSSPDYQFVEWRED
tara:strand:- start:425886 stop:427307 length:1422 start_codon:yes stop_codon:yes gene_type:complete